MLAANDVNLHSEPLLEGDAGTAQTVAYIRQLVDSGKKDPIVNRLTGSILRAARVRPYDEAGEIRAIFAWILDHIRFTKDPEGKELLRPARVTLQWGFGDCDDINAILLPSMLGTIGYRTRLVTIASHPAAPDQFTHVYCEVLLRGRWIPLDAARRGTSFASAPRRFFRKRLWSLDSDEYEDLRGLGHCTGRCDMRRRPMGSHWRLEGLGRHYGRLPLYGVGQFDWGSFADIVNAVGKSTAGIVQAANMPSGVVFPSMATYPLPGNVPGVPGVIPPGGGVSAVGTISSGTLMLWGLGAIALLLVMRR